MEFSVGFSELLVVLVVVLVVDRAAKGRSLILLKGLYLVKKKKI